MTKLKLKRLTIRPSTEQEKRNRLGCFMIPLRGPLKKSTENKDSNNRSQDRKKEGDKATAVKTLSLIPGEDYKILLVENCPDRKMKRIVSRT